MARCQQKCPKEYAQHAAKKRRRENQENFCVDVRRHTCEPCVDTCRCETHKHGGEPIYLRAHELGSFAPTYAGVLVCPMQRRLPQDSRVWYRTGSCKSCAYVHQHTYESHADSHWHGTLEYADMPIYLQVHKHVGTPTYLRVHKHVSALASSQARRHNGLFVCRASGERG